MTPPRTGFEKWKDGIDRAINDVNWSFWDCEIQKAVEEFNAHLLGTAGYRLLDWQIIKAIIWTESGAANPEWRVKPMRIGVHGDPGLAALLSGNEGGDLILPPDLKEKLTTVSARTLPAYNIRAGIGYLLMRMATYAYQSLPGVDPAIYEVTVKSGDSFDKIAKAQGSTTDTLKKLNPTVNPSALRPGQVLKCQKASIKRVITGWRHISTALIADRYNGGGDSTYQEKLDYVLSAIHKAKVATCEK